MVCLVKIGWKLCFKTLTMFSLEALNNFFAHNHLLPAVVTTYFQKRSQCTGE